MVDGSAVSQERSAFPADLYGKLVLLTGVRLLVGTALLVATAVLTLGTESFPRNVETYLYAIIGAFYVAALVSVLVLRRRRFLTCLDPFHLFADPPAATGPHYQTGRVKRNGTILHP